MVDKMTKTKPQKKAGGGDDAVPKAASAAPKAGGGHSSKANKSAASVLPSGGLALPRDGAPQSNSTVTTPGAATPPSESSGGYFSQFKGFSTEAVDAGFINKFNKLALQEGWSKKEKSRRRCEAVESEFAHAFGTDTKDVSKWQELCRVVGIDAEGLTSITKCKKALKARKIRVNLVNLVDHLHNGTPLLKFKTEAEFRRYTMKPAHRMEKSRAKQDGFIRVLLRRVF